MIRHSFLILAGVLTTSSMGFQNTSGVDSARTAQIDQMLSWLPEDTETVIAATQPWKSLPPIGLDASLAATSPHLTELCVPDCLERPLGIKFEYAIHGVRRFRGRHSLGAFLFEGCDIFSLGPAELSRMRSLAGKKSIRHGEVGGLKVYVYEESGSTPLDKVAYYVAFDNGLMFCATDKPYLAEVLKRRAHPEAKRALPESLEQWKHIDKTSPMWAVREVSAQWKDARPSIMGGGQLVGYAISLDSAMKRLTVVSISDSPTGSQQAIGGWIAFLKQDCKSAPIEAAQVDSRTTRIVLDANNKLVGRAILAICFALGHGALF